MSELWSSFVDSWERWSASYLTALLAAGLLALCGVFVVAQRRVFLGVAITQASSLGIALSLVTLGAFFAEEHHVHHGTPIAASVAFAIAASIATSRSRRGRAEADAIGAWILLLGSSGSVLLLSHGPHGLEEVQRLALSSLIGADDHDVVLFGALLIASVAGVAVSRRDALLVSTDPVTAHALGRAVKTLQIGIATWVGLAIGVAVHATGSLFAFACLVLPALAAREICGTMTSMLWTAPVVATTMTFLSLFTAHAFDLPPGQVTAALLAALLLMLWSLRAARPR